LSTEAVYYPTEDPENVLTDAELTAMVRALVRDVVAERRADEIIAAVAGLDRLEDASELVRCLTGDQYDDRSCHRTSCTGWW